MITKQKITDTAAWAIVPRRIILNTIDHMYYNSYLQRVISIKS